MRGSQHLLHRNRRNRRDFICGRFKHPMSLNLLESSVLSAGISYSVRSSFRMDLSQKKQEFSNAYVKAVAAVCGYATHQPSVDDDSVDLGIAARGGGGTVRSPKLDLQLKCTARHLVGKETVD